MSVKQPVTDEEAILTLRGEKLNFPYLLAKQIITFQNSLLATENSEREIKETVTALVHHIPDQWKDKEFEKDLEKAGKKQRIDIRPVVAGNLRMRKDVCESLGIPHTKVNDTVDYMKMLQSVFNLLQRKEYIGRTQRVEQLEDIEWDESTFRNEELRESKVENE